MILLFLALDRPEAKVEGGVGYSEREIWGDVRLGVKCDEPDGELRTMAQLLIVLGCSRGVVTGVVAGVVSFCVGADFGRGVAPFRPRRPIVHGKFAAPKISPIADSRRAILLL